jgi:hypothetical protein
MVSSSRPEEHLTEKALEDHEVPVHETTQAPLGGKPNPGLGRDASNGKPAFGLRKRISAMRVRVTEGYLQPSAVPPLGHQTRDDDKNVTVLQSTIFEPTAEDLASVLGDGRAAGGPTVAEKRFRGRVFRWMRAAKHAVITCGSRKSV